MELPTDKDWQELRKSVIKYGLWNSHRLAIAPNGSIVIVVRTSDYLY
ncbi:MAG: hypothetical protein Q8850_02525 [Candidatus Phytoplasma australasiaticum]|nr:hypothetical protein [Candidatus Phytoplasma australasiaticum]